MTTESKAPLREDEIARELMKALDAGSQLGSLSERGPGFDLPSAYRVAAAVRRMREERGDRVVGRKIGFTNRTVWSEQNVAAPIWGYMYEGTVRPLAEAREPQDFSRYAEPRIEPEVVFGLERAPEPGMDERALLECVDWIAHGFEIVHSPFPDWRFSAADGVAGFGLHGVLLLGPRHRIAANGAGPWFAALPAFEIALLRDGAVVDRGGGANVLGGPLSALRHLVEVLAEDPLNPALAAGEIVTTGTLTQALPLAPGQTWTTTLTGIPLEGLELKLA